MELKDAIRNRHSIRSYSKKEVEWKNIIEILDAARFAPTAGNISTIRIVVVEDAAKRQRLAEAAGQDFIAEAPFILVVCSDNSRLENAYGKRGKEKYSKQQAGAAIQNMLLRTTDLGLASCWIGAFDDMEVRNIIAVPDEIEIEALLPIAHKSFVRELPRAKPDLKTMLYFERWKQKTRKKEKRPEAL